MYYDATTGADITDDELASMLDDLINEIYPVVTIGIYTWLPADALKRMDPVAYRLSVIEYADQLHQAGQITETPPTCADLGEIACGTAVCTCAS
jgi:hypothetical protein